MGGGPIANPHLVGSVFLKYRIIRGDKLVVGRVNEEVKGGFEGVLGGLGRSRGVKGGLLDPYRTRFAPLEVF